MKRISNTILAIVAVSLTTMPAWLAEAGFVDPLYVLDRVIIAERGDQGSGSVDVVGLNSSGGVDWSTSFGPGGPVGFSAAALSSAGLLAIADIEGNRIIDVDPNNGTFNGNLLAENPPFYNIRQPVGLAFSPDGGTLYVANQAADQRVTRWVIGVVYDNPFITEDPNLVNGVTLGADGNLYVADHVPGSVRRYQGPGGAMPGDFIDIYGSGLANFPDHPAFFQGELYVSASDGIYKHDGAGGFTKFTSGEPAADFHLAAQFEFALDGYLYVAAGNKGTVLRYDNLTGAYVDTFTSSLDYAWGLALQSHIIPEPATAGLFLAGLIGICIFAGVYDDVSRPAVALIGNTAATP